MISNFLWIFLLILQCGIVTPRSTLSHREKDVSKRQTEDSTYQKYNYESQNKPKDDHDGDEQVISVRITSSIAVGRSKPKAIQRNPENDHDLKETTITNPPEFPDTTTTKNEVETVMTEIPPNLVGANIEFIRQLNAKKDARSRLLNLGQVHPLQLSSQNSNETETLLEKLTKTEDDEEKADEELSFSNFHRPQHYNQEVDSLAESSLKSVLGIPGKSFDYENIDDTPSAKSILHMPLQMVEHKMQERGSDYPRIDSGDKTLDRVLNNDTEDTDTASSVQSISTITNTDDNDENVPLARSLPFSPSSKNYIQGLSNKPPSERGNNPSLTTVSFNIVHDTPKQTTDYNVQSNIYTNTNQGFDNSNKFYEPPKVYSQPAKIYSEPAKFYSEPAKVYSEPAKIYSEPAKVYSEPAKIYSEPAKFYSPRASLNLPPDVAPNYTPWQDTTQNTDITSTMITTTPTTIDTVPPDNTQNVQQQPEKNYEVDEKVSVQTDGRSHGVQETTTEKCKQDNCKVGYVVEGRQYKKYRVEERTPDGFIVGEYGVVRNEDGALRGVRYTADSDASPRLIYDALMKFLQLK